MFLKDTGEEKIKAVLLILFFYIYTFVKILTWLINPWPCYEISLLSKDEKINHFSSCIRVFEENVHGYSEK